MKICFIACFYKTIFFKSIANQLEEKGHKVFWISTSIKWSKYLIKNGTNAGRILRLKNSSVKEQLDAETLSLIYQIEQKSEHTFKQVYWMDRIQSKKSWKRVKNLFGYIVSEVKDFLEKNKIRIVFGEATAAHEILTSMTVRAIGGYSFVPSTIRIPAERFAFFIGHLEKSFAQVRDSSWSIDQTVEFLKEYREKREKPYYLNMKDSKESYFAKSFFRKIIGRLHDIYIEKNENFSQKTLYYQLFNEKKYLRPLNVWLIKLLITFRTIKKKGKYILFPLQVQPESSVDVIGIENSNQFETIKKISSILPSDYKLLVKEHPNAIGMRNPKYLNRIARLPGVVIVEPSCNTFDLFKYVDMVCSISGTVCYEAALLKKPSLTFTKLFFNQIPNSHYSYNPYCISSFLKINHSEKDEVEALHKILSNSHYGIISDPISYPECMSKKNIYRVSDAFHLLISNYSKK